MDRVFCCPRTGRAWSGPPRPSGRSSPRCLQVTQSQHALVASSITNAFKKKRNEHVTALDDASLTIRRGEVVGLLGPNGSGKSTLVRVISTLVEPDAGTVSVIGIDALKDVRAVQRTMNRVSVEASFFKEPSATENLL